MRVALTAAPSPYRHEVYASAIELLGHDSITQFGDVDNTHFEGWKDSRVVLYRGLLN